jgi:hypothetical protein
MLIFIQYLLITPSAEWVAQKTEQGDLMDPTIRDYQLRAGGLELGCNPSRRRAF